MEERYRSLNGYLRETFGKKVYKLALDGGMTCPNRDGTLDTRGCIFCSRGGSGEFAQEQCPTVEEQIHRAKLRLRGKYQGEAFIAYFQSFTNTYAPVERLRSLFTQAMDCPEVVALSIATRPDCLGPEVLDLLEELNQRKPVWVELGLQTIHESTARFIRRGYPLEVYDKAAQALRRRKITFVTHVIMGLPGETREQMLETVKYLGKNHPPDGIKLQLLHILRGTDLEEEYRQGRVKVLEMEEYFDLLGACLELLPPQMVIHRLTGDGPKRDLVAPLWTGDKKRVLNAWNQYLEIRDIRQGRHWILP